MNNIKKKKLFIILLYIFIINNRLFTGQILSQIQKIIDNILDINYSRYINNDVEYNLINEKVIIAIKSENIELLRDLVKNEKFDRNYISRFNESAINLALLSDNDEIKEIFNL